MAWAQRAVYPDIAFWDGKSGGNPEASCNRYCNFDCQRVRDPDPRKCCGISRYSADIDRDREEIWRLRRDSNAWDDYGKYVLYI